jgi:hypothetical protein
MQHQQQSRSFHYTPAEIYDLPSEGGREIESEKEGRDKKRDRGRASEMQHRQQSTSFHYTPAEIQHLPSHGGREIETETEKQRARCCICNNQGHSITLLP